MDKTYPLKSNKVICHLKANRDAFSPVLWWINIECKMNRRQHCTLFYFVYFGLDFNEFHCFNTHHHSIHCSCTLFQCFKSVLHAFSEFSAALKIFFTPQHVCDCFVYFHWQKWQLQIQMKTTRIQIKFLGRWAIFKHYLTLHGACQILLFDCS